MTTLTTTLEITVVSVEGLDKYCSSSSSLIRPFSITITKLPSRVVYQQEEQVFRVAVDPSFFFFSGGSILHLQLLKKRRIVGPTQLGWCLIPPSDIIAHGLHSLRFLSYRLRDTAGSRCPLIINLSLKIIHCSPFHTVTGIPLTLNAKYSENNNIMDIEGGQSQSHNSLLGPPHTKGASS